MIISHKITCSLSLQSPISYASILNEEETHRMIKSKTVRIWKVVLIVLGIVSLSSGLVKTPGFWSSYLLDIAGPAWGYVLIRTQYIAGDSGFLSIRFSPEMALMIILIICFLIETAQYFEIYDAHFDPYDYLAYISVLLPVYLIDKLVKFSER